MAMKGVIASTGTEILDYQRRKKESLNIERHTTKYKAPRMMMRTMILMTLEELLIVHQERNTSEMQQDTKYSIITFVKHSTQPPTLSKVNI